MNRQASVLDLPEDVFRQQVYSIISRELGLAGYARFLRTFCSGKGDYTAERHKWQEGLTVEDIWEQMKAQGLVADDNSAK